ncbi:MAG: Gfo/Idh/MocA family oxidoreductase [Prevotellaceae bacterium]|jgi:predicted dehydrogenase|nr:Gfo/Idh/MocA family oxidoreductase [Prevotellaceae bacterium]
MDISRRDFIKTSSLFAAGMALPSFANGSLSGVSANDTINVGLIGCKNMGWSDLSDFLPHKEIRCVALSDIDRNILNSRAAKLEKEMGVKPDLYNDYRKILDRKDVDIVIIGTPDHWHCLQFTDACAAGKDIYVEKPLANSIAECDAMVAAAKKYDRIVQVGQQQRSGKLWKDMLDYIKTGALGTIGNVHVWANFSYAALKNNVADSAVPEGVDYDMWLGPAPQRAFNNQRYHGSWRMFWDYGGGLITDWGVHLLDMGLWGMDVKTTPLKVMATGGKFFYPDGAHETLDSLNVSYLFDNFILSWSSCGGPDSGPYGKNYGVLFKGSKATLVANRESWEVYPEGQQTPEITVKPDGRSHLDHVSNFLECVKTRKKETACTVENGCLCAKYSHLGNIAARTNLALTYNDAAQKFDESKANEYIKPKYRKPWKFPDVK